LAELQKAKEKSIPAPPKGVANNPDKAQTPDTSARADGTEWTGFIKVPPPGTEYNLTFDGLGLQDK